MGVPAYNRLPQSATFHKYESSIDESKTLLFAGLGNLYGFFIENESGASDVYVSFFDAKAIGDVTLGTTAPAFTMRLPVNGAIGKDVNDSPYYNFTKGCVVAVVDARNGSGAPASPAVGQFWFWNGS